MARRPSCNFLSVASIVRIVSGVQVADFLAQILGHHLAIDFGEQPHIRILHAEPVGEGDGLVKDEILVAETVQTLDGLTGQPVLFLFGRILRVPDMVDRVERPINLYPP